MKKTKILALCGGVGGAKLALGLSKTLSPDELLIVVNTGDDFRHLDLHISPDLDTVMYTLAGAADPERGWGIAGETWNFMRALSRLGGPDWFNLGDQDLATHVYRTRALEQGTGLADVTRALCRSFGIAHRILPMSDEPLQTVVCSDQGDLPFQDYFVRLACRPRVQAVRFNGAETARPHPEFAALLDNGEPDAVILCPSNPFLSIDPILSLQGIRAGLQSVRTPVIAISPIVGGKALKGPTARIMAELDMPANNLSIARYYRDFLDVLVIDTGDAREAPAIEKLGIGVKVANTVMRSLQDRVELAQVCLERISEEPFPRKRESSQINTSL